MLAELGSFCTQSFFGGFERRCGWFFCTVGDGAAAAQSFCLSIAVAATHA